MSKLLHNNHNVYILGAGFSHQAGLPLISNFLLQMRDSHEWLEQQNRIKEAHAINRVLEFRLDAASAAYWINLDLENIEELFSLASASTDDVSEQIKLAVAATLDHARKKKGNLRCNINVRSSGGLFNTRSGKHPKWIKRLSESGPSNGEGSYEIGVYALHLARLLGMFENGNPKGENTFITFNYDTILEDSLHDLGLPVTYGSKIGNHPSNEQTDIDAIPVFKLHGSVNWSRIVANNDLNNSLKVFKNYEALTATNQNVPELVPPTWKKIFEHEMESVWGESIERLKRATRIVVIGFSMPKTDMHFKYLLAAGLQKNISLRQIVFVNPDRENLLEAQVRELLRETYIDSGRISFNKATLEEFTGIYQATGTGLNNLGRPAEYGLTYDIFSNL